MSFPNGYSASLYGISSQVLKTLTAKSNEQNELKFLRSLTNFVNVILEGKVPFEFRPILLWCKTKCAKKSPIVQSMEATLSTGCPQNVLELMSSNHVK